MVVRQEIVQRPKASGKQPSLFADLEQWNRYRFSLYLTNDAQSPPKLIWREYRPRATTENIVKDLKEGYGLEGFCLHNFWATEAVMVAHALVFHNPIRALNRLLLHPQPPHPQRKTIRWKYFIFPAQLGSSGGYLILRLALPLRRLQARFRYLLEQIHTFPHHLNCIAVESG